MITIAIATWNRASLLRHTLASIARVRVPDGQTVELIVCDNHSTDETRAVVEQAAASMPFATHYMYEERQGKSFALNRILATARGEWVVFTDDDVQVDAGWLEAYMRGAARYPDAGVLGGAIHPWMDRAASPRQGLLMREFPYVFGLRLLAADTAMSSLPLAAWGANMAVKKSAVPAGGFLTNRGMFGGQRLPGEDAAMAMAIVSAGHAGWLLADATVTHWTPSASVGWKRFWDFHVSLGHTWTLFDAPASVRSTGPVWWLWRRVLFLRRVGVAAVHWRPWPTAKFYWTACHVAHYWGCLHTPAGRRHAH